VKRTVELFTMVRAPWNNSSTEVKSHSAGQGSPCPLWNSQVQYSVPKSWTILSHMIPCPHSHTLYLVRSSYILTSHQYLGL